MGTLLYLEDPVERLAERLALDAATAQRAMRAEIAHYRANLQLGGDLASLARLRAGCAEAMRPVPAEPAAGAARPAS